MANLHSPFNPPPTLVIYHAKCPDGFGAAWLYWQQLGDKAKYVPAAYGDAPPDVEGHHVLMIDVSFERSVIQDLSRRAKTFRLLDHHASACEELSDLHCAHFDLSLSGVGLAWRDLHGKAPMPLLVQCIQDRDLGLSHVPDSDKILHVLDTLDYDFHDWQALSELVDAGPDAVMGVGQNMDQHFQAMVARICRHARPVVIAGVEGLAANAPMEFASAVGHRLAQQAAYGFTWYLDATGRVQASWRSNTTDVIPLAREFGGGGHPVASGARMSLAQLAQVLDVDPHLEPAPAYGPPSAPARPAASAANDEPLPARAQPGLTQSDPGQSSPDPSSGDPSRTDQPNLGLHLAR